MNAPAPMKNRRGSSRPATGGLTTSWLLATALPVCFGLVPLQAEAAPDEVGGNATNADTVAGAAWTILNTVVVNNAANQRRFCVATGSADALNTGALFQTTVFTLTVNNANPPLDTPCERTLQFANPAGNPDVRIKEIGSTCGPFQTNPGANFIRWLARRVVGGNQTILDRSLTVVCTDTLTN